ncbi:META domain-containing protein [Nonlabens antarcticus]|uniref:META domain-containing protein n=1 Tax=Nonlabens antarcticus TaxID=392714 RepID=UPI001891CFFF|nr:META domain-containing protein [Nonlabens antarcticus]
MKTKIGTLLILALAIVSCNSTQKVTDTMGSSITIDQESITTWELVTLEGRSIDQSKMEGKRIQFRLNNIDKSVSGFSGCNLMNGTYETMDGNRVKFSPMASTMMACPEGVVNESEFLNVFALADNYTINGDMLSLNVGRRAPLAVFKKVSMENQIVEKYWKLKTLEGKEVTMNADQEREVFFTLKGQDNRITGFLGCNSISGEYQLEKGNRIKFSNLATSLKSCGDIDIKESEILEVFNTADNYTINGDILNLNVGRRAPLVVFEAIYMQ